MILKINEIPPEEEGDPVTYGYELIQMFNGQITMCDDESTSLIYGELQSVMQTWGYEDVDMNVGGQGWFTLPAKDGKESQTYHIQGRSSFDPNITDYSA